MTLLPKKRLRSLHAEQQNNQSHSRSSSSSAVPTPPLPAVLLTWALLFHGCTKADAFAEVPAKRGPSATAPALRFRTATLGGSDEFFASRGLVPTTTGTPPWVSTGATTTTTSSSSSIHHQSPGVTVVPPHAPAALPTWLSVPRHHLSETNLHRLKQAMAESEYYTENHALKVMYAIEEAASGDAQLVAGACDFLLLILGTVEMGVDALVAAAFHYCASFVARRQGADRLTHHVNVDSFGTTVQSLVMDTARLKELELRASRVIYNTDAARPSLNDADNFRKLLLSETADWRALAIRTVASLYRLRGLLSAASEQSSYRHAPNDAVVVALTPEAVRTAREALTIYAPLSSRLGMNRLKNELESAAFQILYQRQHRKVSALVQEFRHPFDGLTIGDSMDQLMKESQAEMTQVFLDDPEFTKYVQDFSVTARVKQPYSVWKKMLRDGLDHVLQVPDALALRIVLKAKTVEGEPAEVTQARERALCYYAQKRCTERWLPLPGNPRFKDYIESPKANGYQSLHYTAMTEYAGENWTMEIQVRSSDMHAVAEYGLASHWDYKLEKKAKSGTTTTKPALEVRIENEDIDRSSLGYLRKVQQWHWQRVGKHPQPGSVDKAPSITAMPLGNHREPSQHLEPYIRALTEARSDLARDFVFVFLEQQNAAESRVLALPSGACVVDALREGEKSLGVSLWKSHYYDLNGAAATVTRRLSNGDVLTV